VLERSLRDVPKTAGAFARYDQLRRARMKSIVRHGARGNRAKTMGPVAGTLAEVLMPLIFKRMAKSEAMAWQYTYDTE
jgi:FAD-dependent urate hydroxylase